MHLKTCVIGHRLLRTGSANWSTYGEWVACSRGRCSSREQQDNDLFLTADPGAVATFEALWDGRTMRSCAPRHPNP